MVRMSSRTIFLVYCAVAGIDRICKIIFFNVLFGHDSVWYIRSATIIVGISIMSLLIIKTKLVQNRFWVGIILIGGLSNLADLILYQRVVDYLPIFNYYANLSDVMICVGSLVIIYQTRHGKEIRVNC